MGARQYSFSGSTANGSIQLDNMADSHDKGYVAIKFYADAERTELVTPNTGKVTVTVSEHGDIFGSIPEGIIDAHSVSSTDNYIRPNWGGAATSLKLVFSDITNAAYFECDVSRFGGA